MRFLRPVLFSAFFVSGLAGLIYESVWTRYLGLFVGHSAYAQVIVLTVFLGGLAVGALLVGQFAERVRRPLLWYAGMELTIGLIGMAFHDIFVWATALAQATLFPALAGGVLLLIVKWAVASAFILPPAILLGTTFPFMSAGVLRVWPERPGRTLSLLYFFNSIGAACGAIVAGFLLVGLLGLPGSMLAAGVLNVLVALAAWAADRALPEGVGTESVKAPEAEPGVERPDLWRLLLAISFGTALASFIYEIAWIRMLSLVLGSASHSFEIMLSAFILGLALGAFYIQRRADDERNALLALGLIQWLMGAAAVMTLPIYLMSFEWLGLLLGALEANESGYKLFSLGKYGLAMAVMLPSTFCAGMTLPLITRVLLAGKQGERAVGWVYGINTLGSIAGVIAASLILMPLIGLKPLLITGAVVDMSLGVVLLVRWAADRGLRAPLLGVGSAAAAALLISGIALSAGFDATRLNSGVFRTGQWNTGDVVYWKDGRTASVAVTSTENSVFISTNGKPDASLSIRWRDWNDSMEPEPMVLDEATQFMTSLITLAHNPDAREGLVIGHGSGMSAQVLLASPVLQELVTVEIEPAMIDGSRAFLPANERAFESERSRFVLDDAKSYFSSSQRSFDLVLSEPSNPWVSGVSSLFTREFYQLVSRHLAPGGVFGQWLHLYELSDPLVMTVLAALHESFPSYRIFRVASADILIVATNESPFPVADWSVAALPGVEADLRSTHPLTPAYLERALFLDRSALAPLLDGGAATNSDYFPLLDLGAELTRFQRRSAQGISWASDAPFDPSDIFLPALGPAEGLDRTPIPAIRAMAALDLSVRLRGALAEPPDSSALAEDPELKQTLSDEGVLRAVMAYERAPVDWAAWLATVRAVAYRRHGGTRAWVDEPFFDEMEAYAVDAGAPAGILAGIRFERALFAQDWAAAAEAIPQLVSLDPSEERPLATWVDPQRTLDGGVIALLMSGAVAEARSLHDVLAPRVPRPEGDFITRLLTAYLEHAEAGGSLTGA